MKIGVLSDTHDLLRPEAEEARRGNNDRKWAQELPLTFEGEKSRLSW